MDLEQIVENLNKQGEFDLAKLTGEEKVALGKYQPGNVLIIYGSLAPGRSNHSEVAAINGKWAEGTIMGKVEQKGWGADMGYPGFRHANPAEQEKIDVFVLSSDELPANWERLDEFEGEEYKRLLTVFQLKSGEKGIGYIYAINEDKL